MPALEIEMISKITPDQFHRTCHFLNCRDDCSRCARDLRLEEKTKYSGPEGQKRLTLLEVGDGDHQNEIFISFGGGCEICGGSDGIEFF